MNRILTLRALVLAAGLISTTTSSGNPQLATISGARANMEILPPMSVQSADFGYPHQVTIALPASYASQPDRDFPVLWVTDSPLMMRTIVGLIDILVLGNKSPEMIVIGIGSPAEEGLAGVGRRVMDFSPPGDGYAPDGLAGSRWTALAPLPEFPHQADDFLSLLIDQIRPQLASEYRFSDEHILFGHSAGGMFAAYTLFTRPDAFSKMIIGSPYLEGVKGAVFAAEADYAATHDDLEATVFLAAGDREAEEYFVAVSGILESTTRLSRLLTMRHYDSLDLQTRVYSGRDHYTVLPDVVMDGIDHLFREQIAALPSSWPSR